MIGRRRGVRLEVFDRADGLFGWRLVAGNGAKVATSGEGFTRRADARRAARTAGKLLRSATLDS